jgi:hypothetical protein
MEVQWLQLINRIIKRIFVAADSESDHKQMLKGNPIAGALKMLNAREIAWEIFH